MIIESLETGRLVPVADLAEQISGRRPTTGTVWRWTTAGTAQGVLPIQKLYGIPHTTELAFRQWLRGEFIEAMRSPLMTDETAPLNNIR